MYFAENALQPGWHFRSLRQMENEVVAMTGRVMAVMRVSGAPAISSAGLKARSWRSRPIADMARRSGRRLRSRDGPTGHCTPGLLKAAHYLGVKPVLIPVGEDFRVDPVAVSGRSRQTRSADVFRPVVSAGCGRSHPSHRQAVALRHGVGSCGRARLAGSCRHFVRLPWHPSV